MIIHHLRVSLILLIFSPSVLASEIFYFYDSKVHNSQTIFSVTKFDVSKSNKIRAEINKRLVFNSQKVWTTEELEKEARYRLANDVELKGLMNEMSDSYKYLQQALEFKVTKVPAIVLKENGHNWIVYGETNIQKALVLIRNSGEFKRAAKSTQGK
ncbi:DUF1525 domain-containing protein [Pseudoalteromonas sp. SR41-6]|uniref:DUF1525 domain-containing protein n=1 Tax=Pseudoalteromonas sp. SR41-6 TaxID=2760948 RepID=UPI0016046CFA|nr:DUF1525 domain-containing protein [Pseudoalteromonas sp. SR41-6]MBB1333995.1 DUF1525 domain-containing protein [Pseudoalteromonas sp. SR41-6]